MECELNLTKFALSKVTLNVVEVLHRRVANCCLQVLDPFVSFISVATVEDTDLVDREYDLERVDCRC